MTILTLYLITTPCISILFALQFFILNSLIRGLKKDVHALTYHYKCNRDYIRHISQHLESHDPMYKSFRSPIIEIS